MMRVEYAYCSSVGPVREQNEDYCACWQPASAEERQRKGSIVVLADGVGGQGQGELASMLAVEEAVNCFKESRPDAPLSRLLTQIFDAANLAVYTAGMDQRKNGNSEGRMATTLTAAIFRYNQLAIGHVGDCRVYLLKNGRGERLTSDHSYAGVQLKLGLITVEEARTSEYRCVLTRTVGKDPFIRPDTHVVQLAPGDKVIQCCDGLHAFVSEEEIVDVATNRPPEQACRDLVELATRRGTDDNITVQIVHVRAVDNVWFFRGAPVPLTKKTEEKKMASEAQVGDVLDGRFQLTDVIARSGMATIFKAKDQKDDRAVAIKIPLMQYESDPSFYTRFEREEEIGSKLKHPYILRVEPVPDKSRPYLVMELLEGQTLGNFMRAIRPLPIADALKIASRISEALIYLHDHDVIHRDLKPENVMILNDGSIRLMDFGIARTSSGRRLTFGGFQPAMGTPDYMAPEQVRGKRGDARTDIYSLGAILYEMITGQSAFSGDNPLMVMNARLSGDPAAPRTINPQISPQVEEVVLKAMARQPSDRYSSAAELKNDLNNPDQVRVTGRASRLVASSPVRSRMRSMRTVLLGVLIPIAAMGGFLLSTHLHRGADPAASTSQPSATATSPTTLRSSDSAPRRAVPRVPVNAK
ncbi:MAG TPA: protein kinase [Tepidisphaeraceae bacterium]|jgi:serine/threonine-protein kinase